MTHLKLVFATIMAFASSTCSWQVISAATWQDNETVPSGDQTVTNQPNDQNFKRVMGAADVPGLSIARIENSRMVWSRQFGRRAAMDEAVTATLIDAETVFEAAARIPMGR